MVRTVCESRNTPAKPARRAARYARHKVWRLLVMVWWVLSLRAFAPIILRCYLFVQCIFRFQ